MSMEKEGANRVKGGHGYSCIKDILFLSWWVAAPNQHVLEEQDEWTQQ